MQRLSRAGKFIFLAVSVMFICFPTLTFAQAPTGNIRGLIMDPTGAVIPGAAVTVTELATQRTLALTTNAAGIYAANLLLPGTYKVLIEAKGFKSFEQRAQVQAGDTVDLNVELEVGKSSTIVEVSATAGMVHVDTTRSTVDGVITGTQIDELPLDARNFLDLAGLEPGVNVRDGGNIDPTKSGAYRTVGIIGRSGTATRVEMDGIDVTDETVGTTISNISDDAVQEFELTRSSLDLTTSLTSSGAVSIITRSGSNTPHGSAFWYYRNQDMGARIGFLDTNPPFKRTQVGYRAGGPLVKDKLFWFSNWERTYQAQQGLYTSNAVFPNVPYGTSNDCTRGCAGGVPFDVRYVTERLDWNIRPNVRAFYRFTHDMNKAVGGGIPNNAYANVDWTNVNALGLDIAKGNMSHSIRFGHVTFNNRIVSLQLGNFNFPLAPNGVPYYLSVGAYTLGPNSLAPQATSQTNIQSKYDGTLVHGHHTFRYGLEVNRILLGGFASFSGPLQVWGNYDDPTRAGIQSAGLDYHDPLNYPLSDFQTGPANGFFTVEGCFKWQHGCHRNTRTAWYFGDLWKASHRLTLNIGTRWEYDSGYFNNESNITRPSFLNYWAQGIADHPKMGKDKFGPQFGFAWDPRGTGKTSIRAGYYMAYEMNIYNNLIFDQYALIPAGIGPDFYTSAYQGQPNGNPITPQLAGVAISSLPATCQTSAAASALNGGDWSCLDNNPIGSTIAAIGALQATVNNVYNSYKFNPTSGTSTFVAGLGNNYGGLFGGSRYKFPYSNQYNIGVEREVKPGHVFTADFLYNHGFHMPLLLQDLECRRCANTLNVANAQTQVASVLNGLNFDQYMAANPGATIADFGLARDSVFQGRTPDPNASDPILQTTNFLRARVMLGGGVSTYTGLNMKLSGHLGGHFELDNHQLIHNMGYIASWAIGRADSTSAIGRSEFIANTENKLDPLNKAYFGPNPLDILHMISGGFNLNTLGGVRLTSEVTFRTGGTTNLDMPGIGILGSSQLFTTDLNGDGNSGGGAPLSDPIPGTHKGQFNRGINSWADLNRAISSYNQNYAGKLTPAGQALVKAGIFTSDQLMQLGAVTPTLPLATTTNPWPYMNEFNTDLGFSRPVHFKFPHVQEGLTFVPWVQVFNLFNHTGYGSYGGLGPGYGTWAFDYHQTADVCGGNCMAALTESRGRLIGTRLIQFGARVTF